MGLILKATRRAESQEERNAGCHRDRLLLAVAVGFKLYLHSTEGLTAQYHGVVRVLPFSLISFWALLAISAMWALTAAFAFAVRRSL
jgi:hypothetical protein